MVVYSTLNLTGIWGATSCNKLPWSIPATIIINGISTYAFDAGAGGAFNAPAEDLTDGWGLEDLTLSTSNPSFTAIVVSVSLLTTLTSRVLDSKCGKRQWLCHYRHLFQVSEL